MAMAIHVLRLEAEPYRQRQAARQGLVAIERLTEHGTWRKRVQAFRASGVFDSSLKIILAAGC